MPHPAADNSRSTPPSHCKAARSAVVSLRPPRWNGHDRPPSVATLIARCPSAATIRESAATHTSRTASTFPDTIIEPPPRSTIAEPRTTPRPVFNAPGRPPRAG